MKNLFLAIAILTSAASFAQYELNIHLNSGNTVTYSLTEIDSISYSMDAVLDCPILQANIGDSCDDGNPLTINDVVNQACECAGTIDCGVLLSGEVCSLTGRIWMDSNLGASAVATSPTDTAAYGDHYQWGRDTTEFTVVTFPPYDWSNPQNNNLWQGVNGVNNPCPDGFRIPTFIEWDEEMNSWSSYDSAGAFGSPLKLTAAGQRNIDGTLSDIGLFGLYWSNTSAGTDAASMLFGDDTGVSNWFFWRAAGMSVRCIKD